MKDPPRSDVDVTIYLTFYICQAILVYGGLFSLQAVFIYFI